MRTHRGEIKFDRDRLAENFFEYPAPDSQIYRHITKQL